MFENAEVVKQGTWIYDKTIDTSVQIIKWHTIYGTGDYEDAPEYRDDKEVECFYVRFESLIEKGIFCSCSSGYLTIQEAINAAELAISENITWND